MAVSGLVNLSALLDDAQCFALRGKALPGALIAGLVA